MVKDLVNHYVESEDWDRVLSLYGRLTELEREEPQHWVNMAKLYAKMGERDKAIEAARQAGQVDGSLADYVEGFIQSLDQPTSSEPVE
jgi:DNA-binding SARP family transcriptional activator